MLRRVVGAIPKENRKDLAAAVIQRMGRATAGNHNEVGDAFRVTTFLSNWNKLSPKARATLSGRAGADKLLGELENLAGLTAGVGGANLLARVMPNPQYIARLAGRTTLSLPGVAAGLQGLVPKQ